MSRTFILWLFSTWVEKYLTVKNNWKEKRKTLACMYIFKYFEILHITCMDYVHIHALLRTLIPVCTVVWVGGLNSLGSIFLNWSEQNERLLIHHGICWNDLEKHNWCSTHQLPSAYSFLRVEGVFKVRLMRLKHQGGLVNLIQIRVTCSIQ